MSDPVSVRAGSGPERTEFTVDAGGFDALLTATRIDLLRAVADAEPGSVRATARLLDRDVKNVHEDLEALYEAGLVEFDWAGTRKRPVVPYDELAVTVPMGGDP